MNTARSIDPRHLTAVGFAVNLAAALVLLVGTPTLALAIDCSTWSVAQAEGRDQAFEAAIDELLNSPKADQWTTLNKPVIKECLLASGRRIQAEFDGLCAKGMQTGMDALDIKLYNYALGCVRA
ncbi:MAG: hypothetical protein ACOYXU_09585 [Nitrospirota bacterium]